MAPQADSAQVRFPPPLIYLGGLALGLGLDALLAVPPLPLDPALRVWLAIALLVAGTAIALLAVGRFGSAGTNVKPWQPSTVLVTEGPFRWTRNPMYVGMALILGGLAVGAASLSSLLLMPLVLIAVQTQVIAREERYLEAKFGDSYRAYQARVRRWL